MLREVFGRKCFVVFSCASLRSAGIYFQACSVSAPTSVLVNSSGRQHLGGCYGRDPTQKRQSARNATVQETAAQWVPQQPAVR